MSYSMRACDKVIYSLDQDGGTERGVEEKPVTAFTNACQSVHGMGL